MYKLSQKVLLRISDHEWIDIYTDFNEQKVRDYAKKILSIRPDAILSLRVITEEILAL